MVMDKLKSPNRRAFTAVACLRRRSVDADGPIGVIMANKNGTSLRGTSADNRRIAAIGGLCTQEGGDKYVALQSQGLSSF